MTHYLTRFTALLCVVFCCTFSCATTPALAQTSQTFTLNRLSADVTWPQGPVRIGEQFSISVKVRPPSGVLLQQVQVILDGRPLGRTDFIVLPDTIGDGISEHREWGEGASLYAAPGDVVLRLTVSEASGRGGVIELPLRLLPAADADADTLPDFWELRLGLSRESAAGDDGPDGDPDGDGWSNRDEFLRNTHPRGFHVRYYAEGVTNDFFSSNIWPTNIQDVLGRMHTRLIDAEGWATSFSVGYIDLSQVEGRPGSHENRRLLGSSYATIIESDVPFAADRLTTWPTWLTGAQYGYGSHASEGTASLSTRWLFAEGVTGAFHTYVALLNPSPLPARLTVTYFGAGGATPVVREHIVAPDSRATIDVNADAAGLASTDVSIAIDSSVPLVAERSIYRDVGNAFWGAGTSSIGAPAAAAEWFFAEGLTNSLFDTYLLLLNPEATAATVEIRVLRADGTPITLTRTIAPRSRATIHMNSADPALASSSTSFGLAVRSTNGTPIVAERTMWWNDPVRGTHWVEGHTSAGASEPATRWFAPTSYFSGFMGNVSTYLLLANPGPTPATVRVRLLPTYSGGPSDEVTMTVPAHGRTTLDVTGVFPWNGGPNAPDSRLSPLLVESIGITPVPIVAERSIYINTETTIWEHGFSTRLTPLPPQ